MCGGIMQVTNLTDTARAHPMCPEPSKPFNIAAVDPLTAAVAYVAIGWPVFPLKTLAAAEQESAATGDPVAKIAKRPGTRRGFKDATVDLNRIVRWWGDRQPRGIGLPTGYRFDVIDIDPRSGGTESLAALLATEDPRTGVGDLPAVHGVVRTASGGLHLYVKPTGRGNRAGIRPGIDYRGIGGYVVAPGSHLGPHGGGWTWAHPPSPLLTGIGDTYGIA
jgi:hypothetical protein